MEGRDPAPFQGVNHHAQRVAAEISILEGSRNAVQADGLVTRMHDNMDQVTMRG